MKSELVKNKKDFWSLKSVLVKNKIGEEEEERSPKERNEDD